MLITAHGINNCLILDNNEEVVKYTLCDFVCPMLFIIILYNNNLYFVLYVSKIMFMSNVRG